MNTNYVRTLNIDEPLTRITGSTIRHYVKDAIGSVTALTDDTGAMTTTYVYDAFGNVTTSGEATDNSFQFTARENDGTGLLQYRLRYYSPEMQRFISEDPIRLWGGDINYFVYVQNNPLNSTDPFGLRDYTILDLPDPIFTPFAIYDFKTNMKGRFDEEFRKTNNEFWKRLRDNYSWCKATVDYYRFDPDEALSYYKKLAPPGQDPLYIDKETLSWPGIRPERPLLFPGK